MVCRCPQLATQQARAQAEVAEAAAKVQEVHARETVLSRRERDADHAHSEVERLLAQVDMREQACSAREDQLEQEATR